MNGDNADTGKVPELPDLFRWTDAGVKLVSARCSSCGTYFFPATLRQHRPGCSREGVEEVLLSQRGKLSTYTVQHYMCPPPFRADKDITPYGIAMVEFPEGISVAGLVVESDLAALEIGMDMETTSVTLYRNDEGKQACTWAFRIVA